MSAVFKIGFNVIDSWCKIEKKGGKEVGKPSLHQWSETSDPLPKAEFKPITSGSADESETLSANDAEDAIAILRKARIGTFTDFQADDDDEQFKKGQWVRSKCVAIQIIRVEPVAFTTL